MLFYALNDFLSKKFAGCQPAVIPAANSGQGLFYFVAPCGIITRCHFVKGVLALKATLEIIQIIISVSLIALILLQGKSGGLGSIFGGEGGIYKTRRGVEKLLFQATIVVAIVFFVISIVIIII